MSFAGITSIETKEHELHTKIPGQKQKLKQRIVEASRNKVPTNVRLLEDCAHKEGIEYEEAVAKELDSMEERSVFDICDRSSIPPNAEF